MIQSMNVGVNFHAQASISLGNNSENHIEFMCNQIDIQTSITSYYIQQY